MVFHTFFNLSLILQEWVHDLSHSQLLFLFLLPVCSLAKLIEPVCADLGFELRSVWIRPQVLITSFLHCLSLCHADGTSKHVMLQYWLGAELQNENLGKWTVMWPVKDLPVLSFLEERYLVIPSSAGWRPGPSFWTYLAFLLFHDPGFSSLVI